MPRDVRDPRHDRERSAFRRVKPWMPAESEGFEPSSPCGRPEPMLFAEGEGLEPPRPLRDGSFQDCCHTIRRTLQVHNVGSECNSRLPVLQNPRGSICQYRESACRLQPRVRGPHPQSRSAHDEKPLEENGKSTIFDSQLLCCFFVAGRVSCQQIFLITSKFIRSAWAKRFCFFRSSFEEATWTGVISSGPRLAGHS